MADPIEGQVVLLAAAKASVAPQRLPDLIERVQDDLAARFEEYRRRYEHAYESPDCWAFFVESDHWPSVGDRLGFDRRETDALRRAHTEQLLRIGRREGRREEFESALEIREAVVIGIEPNAPVEET